jgi:hypothetical protein
MKIEKIQKKRLTYTSCKTKAVIIGKTKKFEMLVGRGPTT